MKKLALIAATRSLGHDAGFARHELLMVRKILKNNLLFEKQNIGTLVKIKIECPTCGEEVGEWSSDPRGDVNKYQIARQIWNRVRPVVESGSSASTVFGHKGKSAAIDYVWQNRDELLKKYLAAEDKIEYLQSLPWIGVITKWHLAKNFGHDCAKPDRHLVRIAGEEGVHKLCFRLSEASGDRIATVDLVLWRAANLGLI